MLSVLRGLTKQGAMGWAIVTALSTLVLVGAVALAVGFIDLAWWLVAVRTFGAPDLDFWSGLGVLMVLALLISLMPTRQPFGKESK